MTQDAASDEGRARRAEALIARMPGGAPTFHRGLSALLEVDGK